MGEKPDLPRKRELDEYVLRDAIARLTQAQILCREASEALIEKNCAKAAIRFMWIVEVLHLTPFEARVYACLQ
jgi:hypothetical protein